MKKYVPELAGNDVTSSPAEEFCTTSPLLKWAKGASTFAVKKR